MGAWAHRSISRIAVHVRTHLRCIISNSNFEGIWINAGVCSVKPQFGGNGGGRVERNAVMASAMMTWVWIGLLLAQVNNAESRRSGQITTVSRSDDHGHLRNVRPNDHIEGTFPSPVWSFVEGKDALTRTIVSIFIISLTLIMSHWEQDDAPQNICEWFARESFFMHTERDANNRLKFTQQMTLVSFLSRPRKTKVRGKCRASECAPAQVKMLVKKRRL